MGHSVNLCYERPSCNDKTVRQTCIENSVIKRISFIKHNESSDYTNDSTVKRFK